MEDSLTEARTLVLQYSNFVQSKDLDSILDALSDEATFQIPNSPVLEGKPDIRQFYEQRFQNGSYDFHIDITDEKVISEIVFINGIMTRTHYPDGTSGESRQQDFSFILKREAGNKLKIWQIRVA